MHTCPRGSVNSDGFNSLKISKENLWNVEKDYDSHQKCPVYVMLPCQSRLECLQGLAESSPQNITAVLGSKGFVKVVPDNEEP